MLNDKPDSAVILRRATPADAGLIAQLTVSVQQLHAEQRPGEFKFPLNLDLVADWLVELLAREGTTATIAEIAGEPVGCIICVLRDHPDHPLRHAEKVLHVDQLSVIPGHQRSGIGRRLMQVAEDFAKEMNIRRVTLDVWAFNENALAFYRKTGYQPMIQRMEKKL